MSAYCTQADILGEIQEPDLIALTDDVTPPTGAVNSTVLDQVIANASGMIDRYVGNIYVVPFVTTPPSVRSLAITISCYRLYRRRLVPNEKNIFTEDYLAAIAFLEAVNKGELKLDLDAERDFSQVSANTTPSPWGSGNTPTKSI